MTLPSLETAAHNRDGCTVIVLRCGASALVMVVQEKKGTNTRPVDEFTNNTLCAWLLLFSAPQVGLECSTAISTVTRHLQLEYSNESIRHSYSGQWRQCLAQGAILGRNTDKTITRKRIVCVSVCTEKEFPPRCGSLSLPLSLSVWRH